MPEPDFRMVTVRLPYSLVTAFVEWCERTGEHRGVDWEPLVVALDSAKPLTADSDVSTKGDDEHAFARSVNDPPAVLCWALIVGTEYFGPVGSPGGGTRVCVETLDRIDLVCPVHGKRRPPR